MTVFEVDDDLLNKSLTLNSKKINASQVKKNIDLQTRTNLLQKFITLCRYMNIDPLNDYSIHFIIILCSKLRNRLQAAVVFDDLTSNVSNFKADIFSEDFNLDQDILTAETDWIMLLCNVKIEVCDENKETMAALKPVANLTMALKDAGVGKHYDLKIDNVLMGLTAMSPCNTKNPKMLQSMFNKIALLPNKDPDQEMEFKCLQVIANYLNDNFDDDTMCACTLQTLNFMHINHTFFQDIKHILRQNELDKREAINMNAPKCMRFQLRNFVQELSGECDESTEYAQTYQAWSNSMNFSNLTSGRRQEFIYFFAAQGVDIDLPNFKSLFSESEISRLRVTKLSCIDATCLIRVIHSMRIYKHNIPDLIDFRSECLHGINSTQRRKLSLPQVLQLYVSMWQHESVRQTCWKSVIQVWNHTISTACTAFRKKSKYHLPEVLQLLIECYREDLQIN